VRYGREGVVRILSGVVLLCLLAMLGFRSNPVAAEVFGGIDFPEGAASFADAVASYDPVFDVPGSPSNTDSEAALGPPDDEDVSLGNGGSITLQFTDNALTGSGDSAPDLHIFESGGENEATFVEISADGSTFESIGEVFGSTASIDLDAFGFGPGDQFFFVRLTDDEAHDPQPEDERAGADIDAVGAISTVVNGGGTGDHATVTVHKAVCPEDFGDPFVECHDNRLAGVDFAIDGFEVGSQVITTDGDGVATAIVLEASASGEITLSEETAVFENYLGAYVYCSELASDVVLVNESAPTGSVTFAASQGDEIVCDWYNLSEPGGAEPAPDPEPTPADPDVVTLPNTGTGRSQTGNMQLLVALLSVAAACAGVGLRRTTKRTPR
jgi:hypothetical protein